MTGDKDFDLLQNDGDPLEKLICRDFEELSKVIFPYARVWSHHIYPRRIGDGSEVVPDWMAFAGCHYTALVRLHHALIAKRKILALCKKAEEAGKHEATTEDYARLLSVHAACAAFWDNLGASIDNFMRAKEEAKTILGVKKEKRKEIEPCPKCGMKSEPKEKLIARTLSPSKNPKLYYAFERRHQFIHSILVPHRIDGGMIVFNVRHYDDAATNWSRDVEVWQNINSQINEDWDKVLTEFGDTWSGFLSWMQSEDKDRPASITPDRRLATTSTPLSASKENVMSGEEKKPAIKFNHPISGDSFPKRT